MFSGIAKHSESNSENNSETNMETNKEGKSDIPGLSSRVKTPLSFLGLYGTPHTACKRHDIPALKV